MKEEREIRIITLGVEGEFEIRSLEGGAINPREIGVEGLHTPVGVDGAGSIAEIRSQPGTPHEVYKDILQLKKVLEDKASEKGYIVTTFSLAHPTGLHIHFGAQPHVSWNKYEDWVKMMMEIGRLHVNWNPWGRVGSSYGAVDDYREQPWGIEYRALPGTLLSNPVHFYQTLRIAWRAAKAVVQGSPITYPKWWEEYKEKALKGPRIPKFYLERINSMGGLLFYDEWTPENQEVVKALFSELKIVKRLQKRSLRPIKIRLFGLRKDRGIVYSAQFDIPGAKIPRCSHYPEDITNLGIPWEFRNKSSKKAELVQLVKAFLAALENNIPWLFKK